MYPTIHNVRYARQGNMSTVTIGESPQFGAVVLKVITPRLEGIGIFIKRWKQEVYITSKLSKLTCVPEVLLEGSDPKPWYLQKYVGSSSLRDWIEAQTYPLDKQARFTAVQILSKILDIVCIASENRVVHRDITPDNIVLDRLGQPFLIDWGLGFCKDYDETDVGDREQPYNGLRCSNPRLTEVWRRHGRAGYAAPEQAEAYYDTPGIKNDLYSLAILTIEVLKGISIFDKGQPPEEIISIQKRIKSIEDLEPWILKDFGPEFSSFLISDAHLRNTDSSYFKRIMEGL